MIRLLLNQFPTSKAELAEALNDIVARYIKKAGPLVAVHARVFPYLDEIVVNLDGGEIETAFPAFAKPVGETKAACEAGLIAITGRDLKLRGLPFTLQLNAHHVILHSGRDETGQALLIPRSVRSGHLAIAVSHQDLERALAELAKAGGARNGITVEDVRISLRARGARSISVDVHLRARKFLLRTEMDVAGQLEIDDAFEAKISNLKCRANGAIGNVACGVLQPHLDRLEGKSMSLMTFPLTGLILRNIRVTVADTVEVTSDFAAVA